MNKAKMISLAAAAIGAGTAVWNGLPRGRIDVTFQNIPSKKVKDWVRAVIIADLHDDDYGEKMERLTDKIFPLEPDLVLIPGDLCGEKTSDVHSFALLEALKDYPVVYSTGNHEEHRPDLPDLLRELKARGALVPEQESFLFQKGSTRLEILSLPCLKKEEYYTAGEINEKFRTDNYRILLSHRPNWQNLYKDVDCDLVISGHAHGGQWHIPGTRQGLIAPSFEFFPKYTEGVHDVNGRKLLISRGMTEKTHGIFRLYNNPELVVLDLGPEGETR